MNAQGQLDSDVATIANWFRAQGGLDERFGTVFRRAIDEVLDGQRTGRFDVTALAKTEKTYLGTKVEILVQHEFQLSRGTTLDYVVSDVEFDAKWSGRLGGWMIPTEAVGRICLCMTADDAQSTFSVGLIRAAEDLLRLGANKDSKRSLSAGSLIEIEWLVQKGHLPENFLLHLDHEVSSAILAHGLSGQGRIDELFRRVQRRIVEREVVVTLSRQVDGPKRVRDARKTLALEGIMILGHQDGHPQLAQDLGVPTPRKGQWVSVQVSSTAISPDY